MNDQLVVLFIYLLSLINTNILITINNIISILNVLKLNTLSVFFYYLFVTYIYRFAIKIKYCFIELRQNQMAPFTYTNNHYLCSDGKLGKISVKRERRILKLMKYQQKLLAINSGTHDHKEPTEEDELILSNTQEVKFRRKAGS